MSTVYLSLGSNLGNRLELLAQASKLIEERIGKSVGSSAIYETVAWGYEGGDYLNQVIQVETSLEPQEVLDEILEIENTLGRAQRTGVYTDREIDVDILLYDNLTLLGHDLVIPHPHMHERNFVLVPMCDLAPDLIHPSIGRTMSELCEEVQKDQHVQIRKCAINT